ncbi:MAG: hypothetical protein QG558_254 [Campylobacterota bacterium]|nr:hypothetical protein [Campylobacterota bacterium]
MKSFEDLQELGANVIHEQTHIARAKLELLLNKTYGDLSRVQFMGFMSILEREYGIDLSDIRQEYDEFMQTHPEVILPKSSVILQAQSRSRQKWVLGGIVVIAVLIALGSMTQGKLSISPSDDVIKLSSTDVQVVDQNTDVTLPVEMNVTGVLPVAEANVSVVKHEKNTSTASVVNFESAMNIKPIAKVWVGMMDMHSGKKTQKVTKDSIVLDGSKNTLFMFGHGRLEIMTPEGNKTLRERNAVWFTLEDGKLQQINEAKFTEINKGTNW